MQLDWIDDLLAVIDSGSLTRAAERRFLTQSAFTRRVRGLEERIGSELFDRSSKPLKMLPGVLALEPEMRELSVRLRRLQQGLKAAASGGLDHVTFACQHAITTTISPLIVKHLTGSGDVSVRVRSGNRDKCLMQLLSGEADFAIAYEQPDGPGPLLPRAFEARVLGVDQLVPVVAPVLHKQLNNQAIPVISYPADVFLGRIVSQCILPALPDGVTLSTKAETALTLAACEYALDGIGLAWLPLTLVENHIDSGRLAQVGHLPDQTLNIALIRLSGPQPGRSEEIWRRLLTVFLGPEGS